MGAGGRNITTRYHGVYATFIIVLYPPQLRLAKSRLRRLLAAWRLRAHKRGSAFPIFPNFPVFPCFPHFTKSKLSTLNCNQGWLVYLIRYAALAVLR